MGQLDIGSPDNSGDMNKTIFFATKNNKAPNITKRIKAK